MKKRKSVVKKYLRPSIKTKAITFHFFLRRTSSIEDGLLLACAPQESSCGPSSDKRLKKNIVPIKDGLKKILTLNGVEYQWNRTDMVRGITENKREIGVIAQDVELVLPELVTFDEGGFRRVDYQKLTAVLIEAVKELNRRVIELEKK